MSVKLEKIRIIIVDDHKIVRDGLKSLLLGENSVEVIGESPDGYHLLESLRTLNPDVLIVDVAMPGISGIEVTKIVMRDHPGIRVLILSANEDKFTLTSAVKAGAMAYLSKDVSREELVSAIKIVASGKHYFGTQMHRAVFESMSMITGQDQRGDAGRLTERETDIVRLFAEGYSYKQIAEKLFISVRTVETHKKNILEKLQLENTVDLVKYAIQEGLIKV